MAANVWKEGGNEVRVSFVEQNIYNEPICVFKDSIYYMLL